MAKFTLRKIHRQIAPIIFLPLSLTVLTGVIFNVAEKWFGLEGEKIGFLMQIHTGKFLHLEKIYPFLNGLGAIAMIITGIIMILPKKRPNNDI